MMCYEPIHVKLLDAPTIFVDDLATCVGMSLHGSPTEIANTFARQKDSGKRFYALCTESDQPVAMFSMQNCEEYLYYDCTTRSIEALNSVCVLGGWFVPVGFRKKGLLWVVLNASLRIAEADSNVSACVSGVRAAHDANGEPLFLKKNRDCWAETPTEKFGRHSLSKPLVDTTPSVHDEAWPSDHVLSTYFQLMGLDPYDGSPRFIRYQR